jgi:hypothetical protein
MEHDYEIEDIDTTIRENLVYVYIHLKDKPEVKTALVLSRPHFDNSTEIQLDHMINEAFDNLVVPQEGINSHAERKAYIKETLNKKVEERIKKRSETKNS